VRRLYCGMCPGLVLHSEEEVAAHWEEVHGGADPADLRAEELDDEERRDAAWEDDE
jgi:hypothetical protein